MPVGYSVGVVFVGLCLLLQLVPVPRWPRLRGPSFLTSMVVNEQPHWFAAALLVASGFLVSGSDPESPWVWVSLSIGLAVTFGLIWLLIRALPARAALRDAIESIKPGSARRTAGRGNYLATLIVPLAYGRLRVKRQGRIAYGPAGRRNQLDLYLPRRGKASGPTLIYFHGGGFTGGNNRLEGQFALRRLAGRGWVCISANYGLSPEFQFPDYSIDVNRVIAWAKTEGLEYGVDPDRIILAGSSAGGHITATSALTAGDPSMRPGFEDIDVSVAGVVGIYGYYGGLEYGNLKPRGPLPSDPRQLVRTGAPPFLVVHGDRDTVVSVRNAESFVSGLRRSEVPTAFAILPGAQHTFDLLRSIRSENLVDAIEDFADIVAPG